MYVDSPYPAKTERQAALAQRRMLVGRGMGEYGDLGKLKISFKHPFGKKSIFGKTVRTVGKVAKVAVPIVAGGLALKVGAPLIKKGITSLFKRKAAPSTTVVTPSGPVVTAAAEAPTAATPSVAETVAQTAATLATSALAPQAPVIPGAMPTADMEAAAAADQTGVTEAGMFGGGGNMKTLLLLSAAGAGLLLLSKRR